MLDQRRQLRWTVNICVLSDSLPDLSSLDFTTQRNMSAHGLCRLMRKGVRVWR